MIVIRFRIKPLMSHFGKILNLFNSVCNAVMAVTGAINYACFTIFFEKIFRVSLPNKLRKTKTFILTRSSKSNKIMSFKTRNNIFKDCFFIAAIIEWNNIDINIPNSSSNNVFKEEPLKFKRPESNITYTIHYTVGLISRKVAAWS